MNIFYITLFTTFILAFIARCIYDSSKRVYSLMFLAGMTIILIIVGGFQINIGDTPVYMQGYELIVSGMSKFSFEGEWGFYILNKLLINISQDPQTIILAGAIIINILNVSTLLKYRSYFEAEIYIYITSGYYIVTMNGIRQSIVAAVLFYATKYIIKDNFKKYLIIVLILSTMHESALIMIPIYFIVKEPAWSKKIVTLIIITCIGVILYDELLPILNKFLGNTSYGHYETFFNSSAGAGANIIRVAIAAVPVILSFIKRNVLKESSDFLNIFVNMSLINCIFYAFATFSWIFARFTIYFQIYSISLLPFVIKNGFDNKKERRVLYYFLLIFYFFVFWYEYDVLMNLQYQSRF